ncbi:hypothetical protein OROGR_011857 [Orobanche gracilis]
MEEKIEDMIYRDPWHFRPHRKSKSGRQVFESHPYPLPIAITQTTPVEFRHCVIPRLGLNLKNMSLCRPRHLELVLLAFPNTSRGVVDEVTNWSLLKLPPSTKILKSDIIIECDGKPVGGTLEFLELIWDKVGESVRLTLLRPSDGCRLNVTVTVGNVDPSQLNGSVNLILEEKRVTMGRVFGAEVEYNKMAEAEISSVNKNY